MEGGGRQGMQGVCLLTCGHETPFQSEDFNSCALEDATAAQGLPLQPLSSSLGPHPNEAPCLIPDGYAPPFGQAIGIVGSPVYHTHLV